MQDDVQCYPQQEPSSTAEMQYNPNPGQAHQNRFAKHGLMKFPQTQNVLDLADRALGRHVKVFYGSPERTIAPLKKKIKIRNFRVLCYLYLVKFKGCVNAPLYFCMHRHTYLKKKDTEDKKKQVSNKTLFTKGVGI